MFSKTCEYGLQAILYIAYYSTKTKKVGLKDIANDQKVPAQYLSKILQILVKGGFVGSTKGPNGGFFLNKKPEKINLLEIVIAIDGDDIFETCGIGLKKCSDANPCPVHHEFKILKEQIRKVLSDKSLKELCDDVEQGKSIVNFKMRPKTI